MFFCELHVHAVCVEKKKSMSNQLKLQLEKSYVKCSSLNYMHITCEKETNHIKINYIVTWQKLWFRKVVILYSKFHKHSNNPHLLKKLYFIMFSLWKIMLMETSLLCNYASCNYVFGATNMQLWCIFSMKIWDN